MKKYKYCLIVSQYYHSRNMAIIEVEEDFIEKAKQFTNELTKYKNGHEKIGEYSGDLDYGEVYPAADMRRRYNVNTRAGDMYFINSDSIKNLVKEISEQHEEIKRHSKGYIKKFIIESIRNNHDEKEFKKIVGKYFTEI